MANTGYFATYARFETVDKQSAAAFLGADNIIGDAYSIEHEITPESDRAWIVNPFGKKMGFLDAKTAEKVDLCKAKGWTTVALLALVAFSEKPKPGLYWGQVVIISYDSSHKKAFDAFVKTIGKQLAKGVRPDVNLGQESLQKVIDSKGSWVPTGRIAMPTKEKGTAWVKTQQSGTESLVQQARKGNIGCTIISWVVLLALIALIVFAIHSCGVF